MEPSRIKHSDEVMALLLCAYFLALGAAIALTQSI